MRSANNLLVVDWDYFFYNPLYAVHGEDKRFWLFDWGHREAAFFIDGPIWCSRAASFTRNDLALPGVQVPENWWQRFNITEDAVCEVSDSNMYSGAVDNCRAFDHVWLFDAHHDCYRVGPDTLDEFVASGQVTCEDWMLAHHVRGSKLHWRWPRWFDYGKHYRKDLKWIGVDARRDDMGAIDMPFDAVSICRSGAWVPPWCDDAFQRFCASCPASEVTQVDDENLRRTFDTELVQFFAEREEGAMNERSVK